MVTDETQNRLIGIQRQLNKVRFSPDTLQAIFAQSEEVLRRYPKVAPQIRTTLASYANSVKLWFTHPRMRANENDLVRLTSELSEEEAQHLLQLGNDVLEAYVFLSDPQRFISNLAQKSLASGHGTSTIEGRAIVLGRDMQTSQSVILSAEGRRLSTYVIGSIGTGKSALLEQIARQDMENDGLCFLDPHEDSAESLLRYVPEHREKDVIFWDPTDRDYPFGLNPFSCPNPDDVDSKAGNFMAALESLTEFTEAFANAPRMKSILRHLALAFLLNQGTTLAETPKFLTSQSHRAQFYDAIPSEYFNVRDFWERFDRRSEREQRELSDSSLNKLERFQIDRTMRGIFGQPDNSIDFRAAMDEGKIIIVKLSSHKLGADNAAFIGAFIVWEIFQAALSRADTPAMHRRQFHLVADEFQTYMTTAFPQLIEQVRKFAVDVTVAHQRRDQLPAASQNAPLVAGNKIVFGVTGNDAEELAKEFRITIPEPPVVGQRPQYAITPYPLAYLANQGHQNDDAFHAYRLLRQALDELYEYALSSIQAFKLFSSLVGPEELRLKGKRLEQAIDDVLYRMMRTDAQSDWLKRQQAVEKAIEIATLSFYDGVLYPPRIKIVLQMRREFVDQRRKEDALSERRERMLASGLNGAAWQWWTEEVAKLREGQAATYGDDWTAALWLYQRERDIIATMSTLSLYLNHEPCLISTGQLEPIFDKPRLYSDVEAEIANTLATLPRFTARCKLMKDGHSEEHTIRTIEPPRPHRRAVITVQAIKDDARHLYGRDRADVEREIAWRLQITPPARPAAGSQPTPKVESSDFWDKDT